VKTVRASALVATVIVSVACCYTDWAIPAHF
jgi:hypothetical protein